MLTQQTIDGINALGVERVKGLIKHPQSGITFQGKSGQGNATALTLRQGSHRRMTTMMNGQSAQRRIQTLQVMVASVQAGQKMERLQRRQIVLEAIGMADVNQSLPEGTDVITAQGKPAFISLGKASHHTQQTGFSTAIGAA